MSLEHERDVAIFRVEGILSTRPTVSAATWMALNAQRMRSRLLGLSAFTLSAPLWLGPSRASQVAWAALEGMSEDRLIVLGELYMKEFLQNAIPDVGLRLVAQCRAAGQRIVLVSDNVEAVMKPFAEALGADAVICNALDVDGRWVTGRLRTPVIGAELGGQQLRQLAQERGIDLGRAKAYGQRGGDSLLLGAVALPCAVRPDRHLSRIARDLDWPVVEK